MKLEYNEIKQITVLLANKLIGGNVFGPVCVVIAPNFIEEK